MKIELGKLRIGMRFKFEHEWKVYTVIKKDEEGMTISDGLNFTTFSKSAPKWKAIVVINK